MSLIDYVAVDARLKNEVIDARTVRGMFADSDHFAVLIKMRTQVKWVWKAGEKDGGMRLAIEKLRDEDNQKRFSQDMKNVWNRMKGRMGEDMNVGEAFESLKSSMIGVTEKICGYKRVRKGKRRGDAWWTKEVKEAVEEKKEAYRKWNERNMPARIRTERRRIYNNCKNKVKRVIKESKLRADEELGRKLSCKFQENKKLFWKEVKKERGGQSCGGDKVRNKVGNILKDKKAVKERWKEYFEELATVNNEDEAIVTCMGMSGGGGRPAVQGHIGRREVKKAIGRLKFGKAAGVDGITAEMLKSGGDAVVDWMHVICNLAWKQGKVPNDWVRAIIVPIYKGKGSREMCGNYRGISLLSIPGKVYGRIVIERVREITEGRISLEQGGFRKGKGCIDQIFSVKMLAEKYLAKGKKLYAAFMDLEKAYDKVDWNALWDVLKIYGVGGQLLQGIKAFYEGANACVRIGGEMSGVFGINAGVMQGCFMSPWLFMYIWMG